MPWFENANRFLPGPLAAHRPCEGQKHKKCEILSSKQHVTQRKGMENQQQHKLQTEEGKRLASQVALQHQTFKIGGSTEQIPRGGGRSLMQVSSAASTNTASSLLATNTEIPPCTWVNEIFYIAAALAVFIIIVTVGGACLEYEPVEVGIEVEEDTHDSPPDAIGEDLFGLVLSSWVRNTNALATGTSKRTLRVIHMVTCIALLAINMILQMYIIYFMHSSVAAEAEESIRRNYDRFELDMYDKNGMDTTENGYHRGHPKAFQPQLFDKVNDEIKQVVCHIPLSQPVFFATILLV